MSIKEALSICGSLSRPGKMPGRSYALPAQHCRLGSVLKLVPGSVCARCYALRGRYAFPKVRRAMEKRFLALSHPKWVEAITTLICRSGEKHVRWHDSGDLQNLEHLRKIIAVARKLPQVRFSDLVIKALIAATKAEEKAVNRVGQLSLTAVWVFQKVSRSLLGIPARWVEKNRSAAWRSKSSLKSQRAA